MDPKGGTFFFLLIVACGVLAMHPKPGERDFKDMAKKLMMKCRNKGYQVPEQKLLTTVFNNSNLPIEDRNADSSNNLLSTFLDVLNSATVGPNKDPVISRVPMDESDKMTNKMWNCTYLTRMIRLMRNSSESSACYMRAFFAPVSWTTLTTQSENNMDSDDYDTLLWASKPALQDIPSSRINLPTNAKGQNMKNMMKMLQEVYDPMSKNQRTQVVQWAKDQITQNYFNCTMMPPSDSRSRNLERCKPSLKWMNLEAMTMMGPYLSDLAPQDVDSSPKEKLCEFFRSALFRSTLSRATRMNPSLGRKFLQRVQECFSGQTEFAAHVDKLGTLACYYYNTPDLTPDLSKKLLSQLDDCDEPRIKQLKKRLVQSLISNSSSVQALRELGSSVTLLSPKQLSTLSGTDLKEVLKNLGPTVQWTQGQQRALLKKQLGDKRCKEVSGEELVALQSVAEGLPSCMLKHVKARVILDNREALRNISKRMRKGQLKAMLQGLRGDADPLELAQKLSGPLLRSISLNNLKKANITSLDQVENKTWSRPQAAYLAEKMEDLKQLQYRRLRSVLQGVTCKMIDKVADSETQDMAQAITETQQWLSKVQAGCAARKLFATLGKEKTDYFKTITWEELEKIPAFLLLHLPPAEVKDLPDSVCPVFLDKMEVANLSSLPLRAPSRPALTKKALHCLANGTDLSKLTSENMSTLGQLLCELSASQLRLMAPDVINSTLQSMASCLHIPQGHRADLIQLVNRTFGNPSDWSAETMETLGPLLLLDDNVTSALPNKPWMRDVLYFLRPRLSHVSGALRKKFFDLTTTTTTSNEGRRKREANSNTATNSDQTPTVEMIEQLGMDNVYWSAAQLGKMSNETFLATVEILGATSGYSADQLAVLSKKATEAFGPVSQMTESVVMQMGCITQGFPDADLERLPFSLDTVEKIAHCGWNDSQMEPLWKGAAKYNNLTAQQLGAAEMVSLNRFICGLNTGEIKQLNKEAFNDAVGSLDGVQCSLNVTRELKNLAVSAFGDPSTWTVAQASDLGNIIAGLDATELASLDPSLFSFLSSTSIPFIPPGNFAALSVAQLEVLGPDNAAMVTNAQRAALSDEQRAALERALTGSREQTPKTDKSGAPSLSVEGISAFVKPLLFLLMGFLLL
ncbi:otoancorin [Trachinotus anak]|uniref:otoancorin n=1 Tax=Trachinotus anak TaxID=443729 RepID=UPI0039F23E78